MMRKRVRLMLNKCTEGIRCRNARISIPQTNISKNSCYFKLYT